MINNMNSIIRNRFPITTSFVLFLVVVLCSCLTSGSVRAEEELKPIQFEDPKLGRAVDFEEDIIPMLEDNCMSCHSLGNDEAQLNLEELETIIAGGKRGPAVIPGKPDESLLFLVSARHKKPFMPPLPNDIDAEELTPIQLGILRQWIMEGAKGTESEEEVNIAWQPLPEHLQAIYSLALSPWGRYVAAGRSNRISIFEIDTQTEVAQLADPALAELQKEGNPFYSGNVAHRDFVNALAFSPNGRTLASGGYRVIKLWKRTDTPLQSEFELPQEIVNLTISPNKQLAGVALADHTIAIVQLSDGQTLKTLSGHTDKITGLKFLSDSQLVSVSLDRTLRSWNSTEGTQLGQAEASAALTALASNQEGKQLFTGTADGKTLLWTANETSYQVAQEWAGQSGAVNTVALLKDGSKVISGGADGTIRVRQTTDGKELLNLAQGGPVTALVVRPDQAVVIAVSENKTVKFWQLSDGKSVGELTGDVTKTRESMVAAQNVEVAKQLVQIADAGVKAAEKNQTEREESVKKSKETLEAAKKAVPDTEAKQPALDEALAKAKEELAKTPDNADLKKKVTEAEKKANDNKAALEKAKQALTSAERSAKLAEEAVVKAKQRVEESKAHKVSTEATQKTIEATHKTISEAATAAAVALRQLILLQNGSQLVYSGDNSTFHLASTNSMTATDSFKGPETAPTALAALQGPRFVSATGKKLAIWDLTPHWELSATLGASEENPLNFASSPFASRVLTLNFSPDGKLLAAGGGDPSRSGELIVWDVEKLEVVKNIDNAHSDTVLTVSFSRDGKSLLSGAADKFVKIHDLETGKHVRSFEGHTHHVLGVSWKADGKTIASSSADNTVKVWNVETGEQKRTISGFGKQVTGLKFIGTGNAIINSCGDKSVRKHDTSNGKATKTYSGGADYMYAVDITLDGKVVASGGQDGVLRIWNGEDAKSKMTVAPTTKK